MWSMEDCLTLMVEQSAADGDDDDYKNYVFQVCYFITSLILFLSLPTRLLLSKNRNLVPS